MPGTSTDPKRRKHILRSAERLFQHYGYGKTTVADIAREANIGVGTVYLEFSSKEAIVAELSVQRLRSVLSAMRKAAAGQGSYAARLRSMLDVRIKWFSQFARQGQHSMELVQHACSATQEAHQRFRADEEDLLTDFLAAAAEAGEFDVADARHSARVLLRLYDSYCPATLAELDPRQVRREIAAAHDLVLHGLLLR